MPLQTSNFDVTNKQIKGMALKDEITVTLKGKIIELEAERKIDDYEVAPGGKSKSKTFPPNIRMEISSTKIEGANAFSELADDD